MFLGYATPRGRTFLDRELYLPRAWAEDQARRAEAGIDQAVEFATKPEQAMTMIGRPLDAGVPAGWVTGDAVSGQHGKLRRILEDRQMPYLLAVGVNQHMSTLVEGRVREPRADDLAARLPAPAWTTISAGAKGPRRYHWARAPIRPLEDTGGSWLLVRRSLTDRTDLACYLCHGPERTPLPELVWVAGARWAIEETFATATGEVGLDQYQVRRYDSWYRHLTLAMLAHAFRTVTTAAGGEKGGPTGQPTS